MSESPSREEVLVRALVRCYEIAFDAWDKERFGAGSADEAKELRRDIGGVLASAGLPHPKGWFWGVKDEVLDAFMEDGRP